MEWKVCIVIGLLFAVVALGYSVFLLFYKKKIRFPVLWIIISIFLGGATMFYPIYWNSFEGDNVRFLKAILMSFHNSLRLFVVDADFDIIFGEKAALDAIGENFRSFYHAVIIVFYIIAPILTASAVLSFIKSASSHFKYALSTRKRLYIFSELNIKSVSLALSIKAREKDSLIIFCDVTDKTKEENNELYDKVIDLHPIFFDRDITSLKFKHHSKDFRHSVHFFITGEDDEKNLIQYTSLLKQHSEMENGKIYLFSRSSQGDLVFNHLRKKKISCRKYDSDFLIIYNFLFERGVDLFKSAKIDEDKKLISVVIVGFGLNGKMLTKALAWFCQMDGYKLEINVYDSDPLARSKFEAEAPELLNPEFANPRNPHENQFIINIHGGIDVSTVEFNRKIEEVASKTTFAFTCLGNDERNLETAIKLRMLFERYENKPHIISVVYTSSKEYIASATNFKGQEYDIECIGGYDVTYSYDLVVGSRLELEAIEAHRRYCKNDAQVEEIFSYAYNYRSSCATVIHKEARIALGINGANKGADEPLTEEELIATEILEHRRWSAYMRSEGYITGKRNDLAKQHHDLILYDDLDEDIKRIDSTVAINRKKK